MILYMKHILFLFPGASHQPAGGNKVVYEYANRFINDGYNITIVLTASTFFKEQTFLLKIKSILRYLYFKFIKSYKPYNWFALNKQVKIKYVFSLEESNIPHADIYVATSWHTAVYLNSYNLSPTQKRIYFIQHFEDWSGPYEKVKETWLYPLEKIVIAPWLQEIGNNFGVKTHIVENGFNFELFKCLKKQEDRNPFTVAMLYHSLKIKGCEEGIAALSLLKEKYPHLQVTLFGVPKRPVNLPIWMNYYQQPNQQKLNSIYNENALFLGTSHSEGWGLTIGEAMICGAAIVATDNPGYRIMAKHEQTALLCPIGNINEMVNALSRLINDNKLRYELAIAGQRYIQQFTWERAYNKFKIVLDS